MSCASVSPTRWESGDYGSWSQDAKTGEKPGDLAGVEVVYKRRTRAVAERDYTFTSGGPVIASSL